MDQNHQVVHSFDDKPAHFHEEVSGFSAPIIVIIFIIAILLGTGVGYTLAGQGGSGGSALSPLKMLGGKSAAQSTGVKDSKKYPDKAEGTLKEGGIKGEGNFHLERPGGDSQNVYLTSSIVDLSEYVGKKVRVMGQTFKGDKAGWLMDVGYVEIL